LATIPSRSRSQLEKPLAVCPSGPSRQAI
jgi:hypothetical protein